MSSLRRPPSCPAWFACVLGALVLVALALAANGGGAVAIEPAGEAASRSVVADRSASAAGSEGATRFAPSVADGAATGTTTSAVATTAATTVVNTVRRIAARETVAALDGVARVSAADAVIVPVAAAAAAAATDSRRLRADLSGLPVDHPGAFDPASEHSPSGIALPIAVAWTERAFADSERVPPGPDLPGLLRPPSA